MSKDLETMGREVFEVTGWLPGMLGRIDTIPGGEPFRVDDVDTDGVWCVDADTGYRLFGSEDWYESLMGAPWLDLTDPATQGCVMAWLREHYGSPNAHPEDVGVSRERWRRSIPEALHAAVMLAGTP